MTMLPLNQFDLDYDLARTHKADTVVKMVEEMGELQAALMRWLVPSNVNDNTDKQHAELTEVTIPDELADVLLMGMKLREIFNKRTVDERIVCKFNRRMLRLRSAEEKTRETITGT